MDGSRCRICYLSKPCTSRKRVLDKWHKSIPTIKDMLKLCVPQLNQVILPDDWICLKCLDELNICVKFIEKCTETDRLIGLYSNKCEEQENLDSNVNQSLFDHDYTNLTTCHDENFNGHFTDSNTGNQLQQPTDTNRIIPKLKPDDAEINKILLSSQLKSAIPNSVVKELLLTYEKTVGNTQDVVETAAPVQVQSEESLFNLHKVYTCNKCGNVFYCETMFRFHAAKFKESSDCTVTCQVCNQRYLDVHNCGKSGRVCNYCFKVFENKEDYNAHMKRHTPFTCKICLKAFGVAAQLNVHALTHKVCMFKQCIRCENIYTKDKINNHLLKIHNAILKPLPPRTPKIPINLPRPPRPPRRNTCPLCFDIFDTVAQMVHHVLHSEDHQKQFPCNFCSRTFTKFITLKGHIVNDHDINIFCERCFSKFNNEEELKNHFELYAKRRYPCGFSTCEKCDKRFYKSEAYQKHLEMVDCKNFQCKECNKIYTPKAFKNHFHKTYMCEICGKSFSNYHTLNYHRNSRSHTSESELVICEICGKSFTHQYIKTHIRKTHTFQPKLHMCMYCSKQFKDITQLKAHEKMHADIRDFSCKECGKMFRRKATMNMHFRAVHLRYRPYKCTECPYEFARRTNWIKHLKIHQKDRLKMEMAKMDETYDRTVDRTVRKRSREPFTTITTDVYGNKTKFRLPRINSDSRVKCHFCGKILRRLANLKLHIRNHHVKIRRFKCGLCEMTFILKTTLAKHLKQHDDPMFSLRCKICFKTLPSESEFIQHSMKHKLDFECDVCHQRFGRSYLLECHKESVHPTHEENEAKLQGMLEIALRNAVFIDDEKNDFQPDDYQYIRYTE